MISINAFAQNTAKQAQSDKDLVSGIQAKSEPAQMPANKRLEDLGKDKLQRTAQPRGGFNDFQNYLAHHVHYPVLALRAGIRGKVCYQFKIDTVGKLTNISILKDIGGECGDAVYDALKSYHAPWIPSNDSLGHAVESYFTGVFTFSIDDANVNKHEKHKGRHKENR